MAPPDDEKDMLLNGTYLDTLSVSFSDWKVEQQITSRSQRLAHVKLWKWIMTVQSLAIIVLLALLGRAYLQLQVAATTSCAQLTYSPPQNEIVYELRLFNHTDEYLSIYTATPSEEVEQAWGELYNDFGLSKLSWDEAKDIPELDETVVLPGDPHKYIVTLSVFHQLHCVNMLRKAIHADYYTDPVTGALAGTPSDQVTNHIGHCLDTVRQSIMCAGDISPIPYKWSSLEQRAKVMIDIPHSCRSWDKITSWAKAHQLHQDPQAQIHIA